MGILQQSRPADRQQQGGNGRRSGTRRGPGAHGASVALPEFGEVHIELPAGCTLAGMYGDSGHLYVRTGPEGLCERVLVLDPVSGTLLGTFVFRP
ncbi:MAG: hypothetical protein HWD60_16435 [Defluviicoccus sp.]|nr:MAG: hypothetical protein HWD60_16435 [Defluviicoccus sp.]